MKKLRAWFKENRPYSWFADNPIWVMGVVLLTGLVHNMYLREVGHVPEYFQYVKDDVQRICLVAAENHGHNVGWIGGPDGEYYVALEQCVNDNDPDVFSRIKSLTAERVVK